MSYFGCIITFNLRSSKWILNSKPNLKPIPQSSLLINHPNQPIPFLSNHIHFLQLPNLLYLLTQSLNHPLLLNPKLPNQLLNLLILIKHNPKKLKFINHGKNARIRNQCFLPTIQPQEPPNHRTQC